MCLITSLQQVILDDLAFYLLTGTVDKSMASQLQTAHDERIRDSYTTHTLIIDDGFDIPDKLLYSPIARDWVEYNRHDNRGRIIASKY